MLSEVQRDKFKTQMYSKTSATQIQLENFPEQFWCGDGD